MLRKAPVTCLKFSHTKSAPGSFGIRMDGASLATAGFQHIDFFSSSESNENGIEMHFEC